MGLLRQRLQERKQVTQVSLAHLPSRHVGVELLAVGMATALNRLAEVVESIGTLASLQFGHGRERGVADVGRRKRAVIPS